MAESVFKTLSDYLGQAADMHKSAYLPLDTLYKNILEANEKIASSKQGVDATDSNKKLALSAKSTRLNVLVNFSQIKYIEGSFNKLAEYVKKSSGLSVDEFLTENNEKVTHSYASVANVLAQNISTTNTLPAPPTEPT